MKTNPLFIEAKNLGKCFTTADGQQVVAVADVSFVVDPGQLLCILGPTGCGKTTLLRLIAGLEQKTAGSLTIDRQEVNGPSAQTSFVFQKYALLPWRNVMDNVAFGPQMRGVKREARYRLAKELLRLMGLETFSKRFPHELSGGMQQRVAIARSLAADKSILLMDEPFGALDEQTRFRLQQELIAIWRKRELSVIFVTHNIDEAVYLADRILIMGHHPGRIVGEVEIPLERPRDRHSQSFLTVFLEVREKFQRMFAQEPMGADNHNPQKEKVK